jgi:hypothetical protein
MGSTELTLILLMDLCSHNNPGIFTRKHGVWVIQNRERSSCGMHELSRQGICC